MIYITCSNLIYLLMKKNIYYEGEFIECLEKIIKEELKKLYPWLIVNTVIKY